eukprot:CAMPEP_0173204840 /NCGR_PEP_ID=MMETSP1141-20130122/20370_1 /TAXON_ID=483371 /ORGANISM="non described non described, Strain CCMP2298" /LENGTH=47 /DNA_ID= /DNA_START= /DNA_END= /DNA_ORIENTATION=
MHGAELLDSQDSEASLGERGEYGGPVRAHADDDAVVLSCCETGLRRY